MARPPSKHPTDAELEVLSILWRRGSSTLREIHEALQAGRATGLTTTLKILQIMTAKGLISRDRSGFPSRYTAALREEQTQMGMLQGLVQKAFRGSTRKMLVQAVQESSLSDEDLKELRRLIDSVQRKRREGSR
jgi:BlaI family transcriptional regulator, penicillinase repressor